MIPIVWRFLLSQYLKVVLFCVVAFVAVLLTTRLDDIAHFATLDASGGVIFLFVLYQIPYILPIAFPIACLISSILLVQRLSKTHELTALRASGLALRDFVAPILIAASFLAVINFYIVSELATTSHLSTSLWKSELRSVNPMLLLRNKHLTRLKGGYFEAMGNSRLGESASEVVMAMPNKSQGRISLLLADEMSGDQNTFTCKGITLITTMDAKGPDQLVIENIEESQTSTQDFSQIMQRKVWNVNNDHLQMSLLLSRLQEEKAALVEAKKNPAQGVEQKSIKKSINRCYSEIIRRISVAFAVLTFTFMGTAFGISTSRNRSGKPVCYVIGLASMYLIA
ncbi:MAG: LptF/LptG family permease, partial [Waddliaceae bacterium]